MIYRSFLDSSLNHKKGVHKKKGEYIVMADKLDLAQEATAYHLSTALFFRKAIEEEEAKESPVVINGERLCVDCGIKIPLERLEARPDAKRCCPCQHKHYSRVERFNKR